MPPIKLARTIPCETALSDRMSITYVPVLPAYKRTGPVRSSAGHILEGSSPRTSSHPTGKRTNRLDGSHVRPVIKTKELNAFSGALTKPGDDPLRIDIRPGTGL